MSLRSFSDKEVLDEVERCVLGRAVLRAYAREIVRLREALREVRAKTLEAKVRTQTGQDCLEISAKALDGALS